MPGIIHTNCSKLEREYCGKQARLNSTNMYEYELRSIATGDREARSQETLQKGYIILFMVNGNISYAENIQIGRSIMHLICTNKLQGP